MDEIQQPPQQPPANPVTTTPSFWTKLNSGFGELWSSSKLFVIIFGVLILIIKFKSVIIDILLKDSKDVLQNTIDKDAKLQQQQNAANDAANALIKQAEDLDKNKPGVGEDWNKK